ncbi:PP2C family protein-serine/threonine phosphatase [Streptomyces tropicalis]|uniref:PP2C family protein-serine/threonine phosphatase n=1 Tax=Streptomyces tropicalis TaxID=3034234 RepID=A0ABT6AEN1_9ACTN|nr:PP2C family protein-serine/threonine phosphatase [Streptomyces tropicalis]MDF3303106.1 PP2C family protein-serine/threonine phosphatase [Streptomyces tropicalis]
MRDVIDRLSRAAVWRRPATLVALLSLFPVILLMVDLVTPPYIRFGPLMVAAPALAAVFCTPAGVLVVSAVTLPCVILASLVNQVLDQANFPVQLISIALISAAAAAASAVRGRRERQLARSRWVAEVTQRVLLHPLPPRVGPYDLASLYLAADEEAAIGGDLYAAARQGTRARVLLGDVQGKGLASLELVSCVLNGFRQSVRHDNGLAELVRELEATFREELRELSAAADATSCAEGFLGDPGLPCGKPGRACRDQERPHPDGVLTESDRPCGEESFVTAVVLELPDEGPMRVANLGHPPPLLLHEGKVTALEPAVTVPPLGLGDLADGDVVVEDADFPPGATLLLYTDGVTEARDPSGDFYPLAARVRPWTSLPPSALLAAVHADLRQYAGARLADDVAMVAVRRAPAPVPSPAPVAAVELTDAHRRV